MLFQLQIACDNAAFAPDGQMNAEGDEVAQILWGIQHRVREGAREGVCRDTNGNAVGTWAFVETPKA